MESSNSTIAAVQKERKKFLNANPWVLLNNGIPMRFYNEEEHNVIITTLKDYASKGNDLKHMTLKNVNTKEIINF